MAVKEKFTWTASGTKTVTVTNEKGYISKNVTITVSGKTVPKGAKNVKAYVSFKSSGPGIPTYTTSSIGGSSKSMRITFTCKYPGKVYTKEDFANSGKPKPGGGTYPVCVKSKETFSISNVKAAVTYTYVSSSNSGGGNKGTKKKATKGGSVKTTKETPGLFPHKNQAAYIVDTITKNKRKVTNTLKFDGVIKVGINSNVKM